MMLQQRYSDSRLLFNEIPHDMIVQLWIGKVKYLIILKAEYLIFKLHMLLLSIHEQLLIYFQESNIFEEQEYLKIFCSIQLFN